MICYQCSGGGNIFSFFLGLGWEHGSCLHSKEILLQSLGNMLIYADSDDPCRIDDFISLISHYLGFF